MKNLVIIVVFYGIVFVFNGKRRQVIDFEFYKNRIKPDLKIMLIGT